MEREVLLEDFWIMNCPIGCGYRGLMNTIGREAYCPLCHYTWLVTCIESEVREIPELRVFHRDVLRDYLREKGYV